MLRGVVRAWHRRSRSEILPQGHFRSNVVCAGERRYDHGQAVRSLGSGVAKGRGHDELAFSRFATMFTRPTLWNTTTIPALIAIGLLILAVLVGIESPLELAARRTT